jgi:ubiquitin-conjugating enzyme E2 M
MLRNKQKKAAAEAAAKESAEMAVEKVSSSDAKEEGPSASILGIGGQAVKRTKKSSGVQRTAGELRIQNDIAELDCGTSAETEFPNPNDMTNFNVIIKPEQGIWCGGRFVFNFVVASDYPHKPPKVTCKTNIYHPNIDLEGAICLNILRDEWKPIMDINQVIYGLIFLFYEPNSEDPLNREAAALLRSNKSQFQQVVKKTMQGYTHEGRSYPKLL